MKIRSSKLKYKHKSYLVVGLSLFVLSSCILTRVLAEDTSVKVINSNHRLGIDYASEGRFKEAEEWFKKHLETEKNDATSLGSLMVIVDLNQGKITKECALLLFKSLNFLQDGKVEEGINGLLETTKESPNYYRPYNMLGVAYASWGDTTKSFDCFMKAIELNPSYSEAYFNLAALKQSLGQSDEAVKYYGKVIELKPGSTEAMKNIAIIYASIGEYEKSINYYLNALRINKNDPDVYYNLALVYFISGKMMKFKENLGKAEELYKQQGDEVGLRKVAEYMTKIKELEERFKKQGKP